MAKETSGTGSGRDPGPNTYLPVNIIMAALFIAAGVLISLGLSQPAISIKGLFSSQQLSILDGIQNFFDDGQVALGVFLYFVSVILPFGKIGISLLLLLSFQPGNRTALGIAAILSFISKWSMTDVFVLAVTVLIIDGRILTVADLGPGAYYFFWGVLISTVMSYIMLARARGLARRMERT